MRLLRDLDYPTSDPAALRLECQQILRGPKERRAVALLTRNFTNASRAQSVKAEVQAMRDAGITTEEGHRRVMQRQRNAEEMARLKAREQELMELDAREEVGG